MKALVLSGGGSKGSHTAGALYHLLYDRQIQYDIICGVSVGAINGAFLAQFPFGAEQKAAEKLVQMWSNISTSKIYHDWRPLGRWHALWKKSLFDSAPLHQLIREHIKLDQIRTSGKQISIGTVSLNSGKYHSFDQSSEHFVDAVIASSAFPGLLTPAYFLDQLWSDGGTKEISPIRMAIAAGATKIDVLVTSPETRVKRFIEHPTTIDIMKRAIDLSSDKIMSNDIEKMEMYNRLAVAGLTSKKHIEVRIIRPKLNLIENLLDFDPAKIREMMQIGYEDAVMAMGKQ